MLLQDESIATLKKFLLHFNHTHVHGMSIEAIEHLARIVLTDNVFIYENKYYRQVIGTAMGSSFALTLANLIAGTCNNPNLTNELVRRSPPREKRQTEKYQQFQ